MKTETYFGLSKHQIMHIIDSYMHYTNFIELIETGVPDPKNGRIYTLFGEGEHELLDSWWDEYIDDEREEQSV